MESSKASKFGKKAMSLFLSGAMVVAFAPAVAPAVAEFAGYGAAYEAFAAEDITPNLDFDKGASAVIDLGGTATTIEYEAGQDGKLAVKAGTEIKIAADKVFKKVDGEDVFNFGFASVTPFLSDSDIVDVTDGDDWETTYTVNGTAYDAKGKAAPAPAVETGQGTAENSEGTTEAAGDDAVEGEGSSEVKEGTEETGKAAEDTREGDAVSGEAEDEAEPEAEVGVYEPNVGDKITVTVTAKAHEKNGKATNKYYNEGTNATKSFTVEVVAAQLDGATAYQGGTNEDVTKTTFVYGSFTDEPNFALDGKGLGEIVASGTKYVARGSDGKFNKQAAKTWDELKDDLNFVPAGEYRAYVEGDKTNGGVYAGDEATVDFTVEALDLSTTTAEIGYDEDTYSLYVKRLTLSDGETTVGDADAAEGKDGESGKNVTGAAEETGVGKPAVGTLKKLVSISNIVAAKDQGDNVDYLADDNEWTCTIVPAVDDKGVANKNVTNTVTAKYNNVKDDVTEMIGYDGDDIEPNVEVDLSVTGTGAKRVDLSKIKFKTTTDENAPAVRDEWIKVTVQAANEKGEVAADAEKLAGEAAQAAMTQVGKWKVTAEVDTAASNYKVKGSKAFYVEVIKGKVKSTVATLGSDQVTTGETKNVTYTGGALEFKAKGYLESGALVDEEGAFTYKIERTKDGKNKDVASDDRAVDGIRDAGTYEITVTRGTYAMEGEVKYSIEVEQAEVKAIVANMGVGSLYDGTAKTPALTFWDGTPEIEGACRRRTTRRA